MSSFYTSTGDDLGELAAQFAGRRASPRPQGSIWRVCLRNNDGTFTDVTATTHQADREWLLFFDDRGDPVARFRADLVESVVKISGQ